MAKFELEYMEVCKAWKETMPAVNAMNQALKEKKRKDIDISTWYDFERTFPKK